MGGQSLVGRQDQIFSGKHHGGPLVIWLLRMHGRGFSFVNQVLIPMWKKRQHSVESYMDPLLTFPL
jgi:hypothetical protein